MAAQSLVRRSYRDPRTTYGTNVMGTVNVLEAARAPPSCRDRERHERQELREPRAGAGRSSRPTRWAATTRTRARRAPPSWSPAPTRAFFGAARRRPLALGARRQRHRRRRLGEDRLLPGHLRAALAGAPVRDPQPAGRAPVAARAEPAGRLPGARPSALADGPTSAAAGTSARRRTTCSRSSGSSSGSPSCGPTSSRWRSTRARIRTRPRTSRWTRRRPATRARLDAAAGTLDPGAGGDRRVVPRVARPTATCGRPRSSRSSLRGVPSRPAHDAPTLPLLRRPARARRSPTSACRRWRTPTCRRSSATRWSRSIHCTRSCARSCLLVQLGSSVARARSSATTPTSRRTRQLGGARRALRRRR